MVQTGTMSTSKPGKGRGHNLRGNRISLDFALPSGASLQSFLQKADGGQTFKDPEAVAMIVRLREEMIPLLTETQLRRLLMYVEHGDRQTAEWEGICRTNIAPMVRNCMRKFRRHLEGKRVGTHPDQIRMGGMRKDARHGDQGHEGGHEMSQFVKDVMAERAVQRAQYGDAHDDGHSLSQWGAILVHLLGQAFCHKNPDSVSPARFRKQMVELAATAMAAAEAMERRPDTSMMDKMIQLCQAEADRFGEPAMVLPQGHQHLQSTGEVMKNLPCCVVLLSRATPEEVAQKVHRCEPKVKP